MKIYCKLRDRVNAKVATSYEIVAYEGDAYSREGDELYGYSFHSNVDEQFSHDMLSMNIYFNEACYKSDSVSIRRSGDNATRRGRQCNQVNRRGRQCEGGSEPPFCAKE